MFRPIYIFLLLTSVISYAQPLDPLATLDVDKQTAWVDSTYQSLSLNQKIGQLFMVMAFSEKDSTHTKELVSLVDTYHLGGIIFSKGTPVRQAKLTNTLQERSKVPLLIAMDAEWGLAMRLQETFAYPYNMTLGAVTSDSLLYEVGARIGAHAKRLGVHINFSPVLDINTNPDNPIIGNRSFGEDKKNVAQKGLAMMKGMQSQGVLTSAKHFPGHGDTSTDSHKTLPTIDFSVDRIENIELYPFKKLINQGVESVMVAHLEIPALDSRSQYPSSLSKKIVSNLLLKKLSFKGLVFTDALEMKGVSNHVSNGSAGLAALLAGNDILLIPSNVKTGVESIRKAYRKGIVTEDRLEHSVKKILKAKYKSGLQHYQSIEIKNIHQDLHTVEDDLLFEKVTEASLTLVQNNSEVLPIQSLENRSIAYVSMGSENGDAFYDQMLHYANVARFSAKTASLLSQLKPFRTVIVGLHHSDESPWKPYQFSSQELSLLKKIAKKHTTILTIFAKPYALKKVRNIKSVSSILIGYQNNEVAQKKAAQIIFGALQAKGKLPVSIHSEIPVNTIVYNNKINRLSYGHPGQVGMSQQRLQRVDSLASLAVDSLMTPGIQLLIARKGKVIYHKTFGHHTYRKEKKVRWNDLYDLASLTKILATLPWVMHTYEKDKNFLSDPLGSFYATYERSNKSHLSVKQMLSHHAGLKPWIPFYLQTMDSLTGKTHSVWYRNQKDLTFSIPVTSDLYLRKDFRDTLQSKILKSELLEDESYKYSDLPYYILKTYLENKEQMSISNWSSSYLYNSIGASRTAFNPLSKFPIASIVPSENDTYYRNQVIQGTVHDMGAAMQGGEGGHAGLFSNANDVAKIMQTFIQGGAYGNQRYFSPETIKTFNQCYFCSEGNRRGVGFDKPQLEGEGSTCGCVSMNSFGHSGFTGTYTWADPDSELVYVFLSNRTYPTQENTKLVDSNLRTEIQRLIYDSIETE
ncbi:MAG: glycoside hydrolase family 3 N-terminal domain-containing protein [Flavobacteriaceae bacterium]|nr:glycoside hydrolase family 3 N-terminal domain-containing protein [Flavobacteriaceae bacterium]MDG2313874.1 glycoside hydrolase family 3 N-terminal domain-containing protein [Flavobacteriaceae bacterium]